MRDRLAIWGAGGHALVVADIIRLRNDYELVGFVDDAPQSEEKTFSGLPLFAGGGPLARLKDARRFFKRLKTVIFDDGCCARELNRDEQRLLENVCAKLGYDVAEVGA